MQSQFKFKVYFVSRDNHVFAFSTEAISEMQAIAMGEQRILDNGWSQYQYVYDETVKL